MITITETKLVPYPLPPVYLERTALFKRFQPEKAHRLVILFGGGGWGKSLLAASYLKAADLDAAWLNLDINDRNPLVFLRYLIASIRRQYFADSQTLLNLETYPDRNEQWQPIISALINALLDASPQDIRLVLDDFHVVADDDRVQAVLDHLLSYAPPNLQIWLLSRKKPERLLYGPKSKADTLEIAPDELGFTVTEMDTLFREIYHLNLQPQQLRLLAQYTDGWPIGVRIFGETIVGKTEASIESALQMIVQDRDSIVHHFHEALYRSLPADIQDFLITTSIFDQFNAAICDYVRKAEDSRRMIDTVLRRELILVCLDDQSEIYRCQYLFKAFLRAQLSGRYAQSEISRLHHRAADFFRQTNRWQEATAHLMTAKDYQAAADCIEEVVKEYFGYTAYDSLEDWLQRIPKDIVERRSGLVFAQGWITIAQGRYNEGLVLMNRALELSVQEQNQNLLGRSVVHLLLLYRILNRDEEAKAIFEGYYQSLEPGSINRLQCKKMMAISLLRLNKPAEAAQFWSELLEDATHFEGGKLQVEIQSAKGLYHDLAQGRIDEAIRLMNAGLTLYKEKGHLQFQCELLLGLYYAHLQSGRFQESRRLLEALTDTRRSIKNRHLIDLISCIKALEAIERQHLEDAQTWIDQLATIPRMASLDAFKALIRTRLALANENMDLFYTEAEQAEHHIRQIVNGLDWTTFTPALDLAELYIKVGENQRGKQLLTPVLDKMEQIEARYAQARCRMLLAIAELNLGDNAAVIVHLSETLDLCVRYHYSYLFTLIDKSSALRLLLFALFEKIRLPKVTTVFSRMGREYVNAILPVLRNKDPALQVTAIDILANMPYREAEKQFYELSKDAGPKVQDALMAALIRIQSLPPVPLRITVLDRFHVCRDNHPITTRDWRLKMASSLFKFLLFQKDRETSFDILIDTFYPDVNPEDARVRLHKAASTLRTVLEPGIAPRRSSAYLKARDNFYRLDLPEGSLVDAFAFEHLITTAKEAEAGGEYRTALQQYNQALALYKTDLLEEDLYEGWTSRLREHYQDLRNETFRSVARLNYQLFDYNAAIIALKGLLASEILDEDAWVFLMKCYLANGNRPAALKCYQTCADHLKKELGITPDGRIKALYASIRRPSATG
jgi:ATP/maltotriose-dependent transcriptional regulator MalT/DNA-binding SARP family transcriptional activator